MLNAKEAARRASLVREKTNKNQADLWINRASEMIEAAVKKGDRCIVISLMGNKEAREIVKKELERNGYTCQESIGVLTVLW